MDWIIGCRIFDKKASHHLKKNKLLNQQISHIIAGMGHQDMLVIADAGLPIPESTQRVELALCEGVPDIFSTLEAVLSELHVEKIILAEETHDCNPGLYEKLTGYFGAEVLVEQVSHEILKGLTCSAKAVIRTGEFTPFANIILVSGVVF
jgi:D-ribose pyranase